MRRRCGARPLGARETRRWCTRSDIIVICHPSSPEHVGGATQSERLHHAGCRLGRINIIRNQHTPPLPSAYVRSVYDSQLDEAVLSSAHFFHRLSLFATIRIIIIVRIIIICDIL